MSQLDRWRFDWRCQFVAWRRKMSIAVLLHLLQQQVLLVNVLDAIKPFFPEFPIVLAQLVDSNWVVQVVNALITFDCQTAHLRINFGLLYVLLLLATLFLMFFLAVLN